MLFYDDSTTSAEGAGAAVVLVLSPIALVAFAMWYLIMTVVIVGAVIGLAYGLFCAFRFAARNWSSIQSPHLERSVSDILLSAVTTSAWLCLLLGGSLGLLAVAWLTPSLPELAGQPVGPIASITVWQLQLMVFGATFGSAALSSSVFFAASFLMRKRCPRGLRIGLIVFLLLCAWMLTALPVLAVILLIGLVISQIARSFAPTRFATA